ncbi:MAG: HD domain-containing protein [Treponema sp.]|jgi:exopolyphosphatase/guanosine-5'-triphosphate,3'-diphosphate pyrophosphatase|nr:HD domain-containing protein [Treponema sp.]
MEINNRLVAVLEIGSTGIRLVVAEIFPDGRWHALDRATKPVALGRDVFTTGHVSRESFLECITMLKNFLEFLRGWGIDDSNVHVIATSALRVARNRDVFVDRVRQETGLMLTIVEGLEENRLMYLAVRFAIKNDWPLFWRANSMILEIGGGSTEIMLLRRGQMVAAHSLKLGTLLIDQASRIGTSTVKERYVSENIRNTSDFLSSELDLAHVRTFVIAGFDASIAAGQVGRNLNEHCWIVTREAFTEFVRQVQDYSLEECMERLQMSFWEAETFIPGILVNKLLLDRTGAAQVVVPRVTIREGFLIDLAQGVDPTLQEEFFSQIFASAVNLGRKYHIDEPHCRHVASLCVTLFDALVREHGMSRRERMMLEVAAMVHEIGMFIQASGHNLHGQYIIANSDIFGLKREELDIIGNVIRYHRGAPPASTDIDYIALQREERILVLKMVSILRVADSLDRGHSRQVKLKSVEKKSETVVLHTEGAGDISLELMGLDEKGGLFQDVFGYKIVVN